MPKAALPKKNIKRIIGLRQTGHTIGEIKEITKNSKTTIFKYIKGIEVRAPYKSLWQQKRGGSKYRALREWTMAYKQSKKLILPISQKEKFLILACLYWGEGNKRELNLINSDPSLIKVFVTCLESLGVAKDRMKFTLRIFEDMNREKITRYWAKVIDIPKAKITNVNILAGKKKGKLINGMCRVRVTNGAPYFKLIMSMINLIKLELNAAVVQRIERGTPKP